MGELIRRACEEQYGLPTTEERLAAVEEMVALSLPVADVETMKQESVPEPEDQLP